MRTHWSSDEFWKMFEATFFLAEQLSQDEEAIELSKRAAIRFWLMFTPVAGHA